MSAHPQTRRDERIASLVNLIPPALFGWGGVSLTLLGLIAWSLTEPFIGDTISVFGDLAFGALIVTVSFGVAWHTRSEKALQQRRHLELLEELSRRDELSGLHNYRYLRESLRSELTSAMLSGTPMSVIMLDLNDFKDVNDRFGHQAGDAIIISIGQAIRDAVDGRGIVARYGGDEFTVLLPETDRGGATSVAAQVAEAIARASLATTRAVRHLPVTASYGIAVYPEDASDPEALIAFADRALYEAKADLTAVHARTEERHSQDVFFAIGGALSASLDPKDLLRHLVTGVGQSLGLAACSIWLRNAAGSEYWPSAYWTEDEAFADRFGRVLDRMPMRLEEAREAGLIGSRAAYFDDASASPLPGRFSEAMPPGSWLISVPLSARRDGFLVFTAEHARTVPPQMSLAEAVARLASVSLNNAENYAQTARQAAQLRAIAGIGGLLLGEGDYPERVLALVKRVYEVTGCDMLTVDTYDPTGEAPFVRQFHGRGPGGGDYDQSLADAWLAARPALEHPEVTQFLAKATEPIVMADPVNQVPPMYRDVILSSGTRSVVVMPITWQGEIRGLFYFASYRPSAFDAHDLAIMQAIAAQIAPAIEIANLNVRLERSYSELKASHRDAIQRLAYAAEARDPYTGRYLQRIGALSEAIARRLDLDEDAVEAIGYAAVVHDLGKLKIPDDILTKPGELTAEDWRVMRQHPEFGAELLGEGLFYDVARTVALHHHERWDGSGYPFGLRGEDIPLEARIVAVADVYDALISARPYKHAWPRERALAELLKMRGVKLCPRAIDGFLQLWTEGEISRIEGETANASFETDFRERRAA